MRRRQIVRAVLASVAVASSILAAVPAATAQPPSAPPAAPGADNGGDSVVTGTPCESALKSITDGFAPAQQVKKGKFLCSGGAITLTGKAPDGSEKQILGNIETGKAEEITGTDESQRSEQLGRLGVAPTPTIKAPEFQTFDVGDPCFPGEGADTNYITSPQHGRANMQVCYGEYVWWGTSPIEIVWSDWLTYTWNLALTQRYHHDNRVQNTTLSNRTIDVTIGWDVRKDVLGPDEDIVPTTQFSEDLWQYGNVTDFSYELVDPDGAGRYFLTQRQIVVEDYATASQYPGVLNHELPRFTCPDSSTSMCTYD
ncbi:hypothetical protein [Rhodococcus koreensis]